MNTLNCDMKNDQDLTKVPETPKPSLNLDLLRELVETRES